MLDKLFRRESPEELVKTWRRQLNSEMRKIDTQIKKIQREEMKVKQAAKQAARKGDTIAVRMLSKEIIHSRLAVRRLYTARAQMSSIAMHLQQQLTQLRVAGVMGRSAAVMSQMHQLMHTREVQEAMRAMGREMMRAGVMEEVMGDAMDGVLGAEVSDTELEEEVSKVVEEVTQGQMRGAAVGRGKLPEVQQNETNMKMNERDEDEDEDEDGVDEDDLMAKYNALRSGA